MLPKIMLDITAFNTHSQWSTRPCSTKSDAKVGHRWW